MACCLMAPSHYLGQCWLIIKGVLWYSLMRNLTKCAHELNPCTEITFLKSLQHLSGHNKFKTIHPCQTWWRHQMGTFSTLLALCAGNSSVTGEFPAKRPVTWSFDVFFGLCLTKCLSKQSRGWWFEKPPCPLWRHCNETQKAALEFIHSVQQQDFFRKL